MKSKNINKLIRNILMSANPLIIGWLTVLGKIAADQHWAAANYWILGSTTIAGLSTMYFHFMTNADGGTDAGTQP